MKEKFKSNEEIFWMEGHDYFCGRVIKFNDKGNSSYYEVIRTEDDEEDIVLLPFIISKEKYKENIDEYIKRVKREKKQKLKKEKIDERRRSKEENQQEEE